MCLRFKFSEILISVDPVPHTSQLSIGAFFSRTTVYELKQGLATTERLKKGFEAVRMVDHACVIQRACKARLVGIHIDHEFHITSVGN